MRKLLVIAGLLFWLITNTSAQKNQGSIKVSPNGVNVNANGATVVFLTFGGLTNQRPADACWCGELIPATPDIGFRCNPATLYGCLPERYDLSTLSGNRGFTDIMSIPPSVARRAYQDAQDGAASSFFYVRRFINTKGGPDEYAFVTCRMAGGGASVPFALTDVKLAFDADQPIMFVKPGEKPPAIKAEIAYNGTGRLTGRWEVVLPGEELPTERDLLTEATLPVEERPQQRRYTPLSRFNVFLPPTGKHLLAGPDLARLPTAIEGAYLVLLRVEVTEDKDSGSNLAAAGAGSGFVQSGAVAGFPLPVLRYFVGSGGNAPAAAPTPVNLSLLSPPENALLPSSKGVVFSWDEYEGAAFYRLEVEGVAARPVLSALLTHGAKFYRAPSWLKDKTGDNGLRWRITALDPSGNKIGESAWRQLRLRPKN